MVSAVTITTSIQTDGVSNSTDLETEVQKDLPNVTDNKYQNLDPDFGPPSPQSE